MAVVALLSKSVTALSFSTNPLRSELNRKSYDKKTNPSFMLKAHSHATRKTANTVYFCGRFHTFLPKAYNDNGNNGIYLSNNSKSMHGSNYKTNASEENNLGRVVKNIVAISVNIIFAALAGYFMHPIISQAKSFTAPKMYVRIPYTEFLDMIKTRQVLRVKGNSDHYTFELRDIPESATRTTKVVFTSLRDPDRDTPIESLKRNEIPFEFRESPKFSKYGILYGILFLGCLASIVIYLLPRKKGLTLSNFMGVEENKEELIKIINFLRNPNLYREIIDAGRPRGVLLLGLPGISKILLAKAIAGEAEVPFISCSTSEFMGTCSQIAALRMQEIFAKAKRNAPSIIFIDEFDVIAKRRDDCMSMTSNDGRDEMLNQLLCEIDGLGVDSPVIIFGATNKPDNLSSIVRRPQRFDRILMVEPLDHASRETILELNISHRNLPLSFDVDLKEIAMQTTHFTRKDLANVIEEAALLAMRSNKRMVTKVDFIQAIVEINNTKY